MAKQYFCEIVEMEQNPFDKDHQPTDPEAFYSWKVGEVGKNMHCGSGMTYKNVCILMQYFHVDSPEELVGLRFRSDKGPDEALAKLLVLPNHGGKYNSPTSEEIFERAAWALANMQQPDFSKDDGRVVACAFAKVWNGFKASNKWFNNFADRIHELSQVTVLLEPADVETFPVRVRGPAEYLQLRKRLPSGDDQVQLLIIGPYAQPITFHQAR